MTNKELKLVEKCSKIETLEGRILIAPHKIRTRKDKQFVGRPKDETIKEEDIDADTEMVMVEEMVDVNQRFQLATVLQVPSDEVRFNIGDTIVYQIGTTFDFDFVKDVSYIRKYDVTAVIKN